MQEFGVGLPLAPLEVGRRVDRARWPLHVTLVGNFRVEGDRLDLVLDVVRRWSRTTTPLEVQVEGEALFGPDRDLPVDLVRPEDLTAAHTALVERLMDEADAQPVDPEHWFDGWRPHVTRQDSGRAEPGPLRLTTAVVPEIAPGGDDSLARIDGSFDLGAPEPPPVDARRAVRLLAALAGVRSWVIGGWGVDALLGERSREHHDLDLLVHVEDVPRLPDALAAAGLTMRAVWSESRWLGAVPSAFVADGPLGEVDVHVVDLVDGRPVPLSASRIELPAGALDGRGRIGGVEVPCATAEAQLVMHTGYEVPARQREDLRLLRELTRPV